MISTYHDLLEQVLRLPLQDRGTLAALVIDSLDDACESLSQEELNREWEAELQERLEAYRSGRAKGIPLQEVVRRLSEPLDDR